MQQNVQIDYSLLGAAMQFYREMGFTPLEVPWTCDWSPVLSTKPDFCRALEVAGGRMPHGHQLLVGSAEQSFMQLMLDGLLEPGKYVACTPCFRHEREHTATTRPYFMKVELIDSTSAAPISYLNLMDAARQFMEQWIPTRTRRVADNQFDMYDESGTLELGSYGSRDWRDHRWSYGTGLAEPRFSFARDRYIEKQRLVKAVAGDFAENVDAG